MKKLLLIIIFLFSILLTLFAAMSPANKECMQRGYNVMNDYCILPEGKKCLLPEFNEGKCGQEYKIEDYCVKQGDYVWDMDKCCFGLNPSQPQGKSGEVLLGHPTCQPARYAFILNPYFYLYIVIVVIVAILLLWLIKKKRK